MATTKNTWSKTNHSQLPAHTKRTFIILNPSKMNSYIEPIKIHHLSLQSSSQCVPVKLLSVYKQSLTLISLENLPQVRNLPRQFQKIYLNFSFDLTIEKSEWKWKARQWDWISWETFSISIAFSQFQSDYLESFFCFLSSSDSSSMKSRPHCGGAYNKREQKVRIFWGTQFDNFRQ